MEIQTLYPLYRGLPIIPSKTAGRELLELGLDLFDVQEILEYGYDCAISRRKEGVLEKCVDIGRKTTKVVVAKSYNYSMQQDVW